MRWPCVPGPGKEDNSRFLWGRFARRPSKAEFLLTAPWLLGAVTACSDGGTEILLPFLLWVFGLALAMAWILRAIVAIVGRLTAERLAPLSRTEWLAWLSFPLALALILLIAKSERPLTARVALSERSLRDYVGTIGQGRSMKYGPSGHRVGLFWIRKVEERQGCVLMTIGNDPMGDDGLAYVPNPRPPFGDVVGDPHRDTDWHFHHIRGPWWYFAHDMFHPWGN